MGKASRRKRRPEQRSRAASSGSGRIIYEAVHGDITVTISSRFTPYGWEYLMMSTCTLPFAIDGQPFPPVKVGFELYNTRMEALAGIPAFVEEERREIERLRAGGKIPLSD